MNNIVSTLKKNVTGLIISSVLLSLASTANAQWTNLGSATGISDGQASDITLLATGVGQGNPDTLYVAYKDFANSNGVTVLMWDGTTWSPVGGSVSKPAAPHVNTPRMAIDGNGQLAIAYANNGNSNRLNVKQYAAGAWTTVGTADFFPSLTGGGVDNIAFITKTFAASDPYYIGFTDATNSNAVTYMHYAGAWTLLGSVQPGGKDVTLAQDPKTGYVYTVYVDASDNGQARQFQTSNWVPMGAGAVSISTCANPVICTNGDVTWAAFTDNGHAQSIGASKYDPVSGWSAPYADTFGFDDEYISMVLEGAKTNAIPLAAFEDNTGGTDADAGKLRVAHLKSNFWQDVDPTEKYISDGRVQYTSVAINKAGDYFVAYSDGGHSSKLIVKKFANPTAVPTVPANNVNIEIYPNPSSGDFSIKGYKGSYQLLNVLGQTIKTFELSANSAVHIGGLASGLYFVKGADGFVSQKIVVAQ